MFRLKRFVLQTEHALCFAPQEVNGALRTTQHEAGGAYKAEAILFRQLPHLVGIEPQRVLRGTALFFGQFPVLGMPLIARHMGVTMSQAR